MNLVTVAQVAVALPAAGAGAAEARSGLRDRGLGAQRCVLVLAADEFCLRWRTLPHLPQTCCEARRHGNAAAADVDWNRCRVKRRWVDTKTKEATLMKRVAMEGWCGGNKFAWKWDYTFLVTCVSDPALASLSQNKGKIDCKFKPTDKVTSCRESPKNSQANSQ